MKKKVVFLLQNGIGFGHFKLALTIAEKFDKNNFEIIFITQAKSTRIFKGYDYKVINIPPTYSLKNNNEILFIYKLANRIIEKIRPSVVIEDTYPDDFYLNLPQLQFVPKILIINRLIASEFENYYYSGVLGQYDKILVIKDQQEFLDELTSTEIKNFIKYSNHVVFCGNVFNEPNEICRFNIRTKYQFDKYQKNIIVNCGAGGWHIGENVCNDIFKKIIEISNRICIGSYAQLILLLGPYSSYIAEGLNKQIANYTNINLVDFEDHSDALFYEADLVILRPGYNSTMEALSGTANVLLLPGISYMENQNDWCQYLQENYGADYLSVDHLELLEKHVSKLLNENIRTENKVTNHSEQAKQLICDFVSECDSKTNSSFLFAIKHKSSNKEIADFANKLFGENLLKLEDGAIKKGSFSIPILNMGLPYTEFKNFDAIGLVQDQSFSYFDKSFYQNRFHFDELGTIIVPITLVDAKCDLKFLISKINYLFKNKNYSKNCICIDFDSDLTKKEQLYILNQVHNFFEANGIQLLNIKDVMKANVLSKFYGYEYGHYSPEIVKLK